MVKTLSRFVSTWRVSGPEQTPRLVLMAYKLAADVVSKGVTLVVFVIAARQLHADELGVLAVAMTTGWLLSVASDAGLPLDLARTVARHAAAGTLRPAIVSDSMQWRGWLALAAIGIGAAVGAWLAPAALVLAFTLIVIAQVVTAALETIAHAFRGLGRSDIEASVTLIQRATTGVAASVVLLTRPSLIALSVAMLIPPAVALAASFVIARRLMGRSIDHSREAAGLAERLEGRLFLQASRVFQTAFKTFRPAGPGPDRALCARLGGGGGAKPIQPASEAEPDGHLLGGLRRSLASRFVRDVAPMGLGIFLSAVYFRCDVYFVERWHGLEIGGHLQRRVPKRRSAAPGSRCDHGCRVSDVLHDTNADAPGEHGGMAAAGGCHARAGAHGCASRDP